MPVPTQFNPFTKKLDIVNQASETLHNELASKQGGIAGEYFHLTEAQHTIVGNTSGVNTGDQDLSSYLTSATAASTYQPLDSDLTTISGLTATTDNFLVSVSSAWASRTPSQVRTTLGLVIGTNVQAYDADLTTWAGITPASGIGTFLATPTSANLLAAVTDETGSGSLVFATSPTLVTPNLGTPSTLVGTNITGTASGLTAGTVTTNANLTGHITSVGNATVLGSFTSAQLLTALTNETGTGVAVFGTAPTFTTNISTPLIVSAAALTLTPAAASAVEVSTAVPLSYGFNAANICTNNNVAVTYLPTGLRAELDATNDNTGASGQYGGISSLVRYRGSHSLTNLNLRAVNGIFNSIFVYNTGTTNWVSGFYTDMRNLGTGGVYGNITNMAVYRAVQPSLSGGTVTNMYGMYIDTMTVASRTTNAYGVYQVGTADINYFAGSVGIGTTGPTAVLHIKAGTATANTAPLKFTSGTLNTTAEAGAVEFLTDAFYGTITTGAVRKTFAFLESPTLVTPVIGVATGTSLAVTGLVTSSGTAGIGYATGAGGAVTQATSKATAFTLSKICGTIQFAADALAADTTVSATWTNTTIAATDVVHFTHSSGGTLGAYNVACAPGAGSATIYLRNLTPGSLSEAPIFRFAVIKGVVS